MIPSKVVAAFSVLSLSFCLGCGQAKKPDPKKDPPKVESKPTVVTPPKTEPAPETKPASASAPASTSAPAAAALTAPAGHPAYPFEGLPGYLSFATITEQKDNKYFWSVVSTKSQTVMFGEGDDSWSKTAPGLKLIAIGKTNASEVELTGINEEPFGCDNIPKKMTTFKGAALPEGPVWLLPKDSTGFSPVEVKEGAVADLPAGVLPEKTTSSKVVVAGPVTLVYFSTEKTKGKLVVLVNKEKKLEQPLEKHYMEGAPDDPLDVKQVGEIGVPEAIGAFQFGQPWPIAVVLEDRSYEGIGFSILRVTEKEAKLLEGPSSYYCAF